MTANWSSNWLFVTHAGSGDNATFPFEPTPQPMVKDAVVFAPTPDKEALLVQAARRMMAAQPLVDQAEPAAAQ